MKHRSICSLLLLLHSILYGLLPGIAHADWWLYGGQSSYASDPLRDDGYYAGASVFIPREPFDIEAGAAWSTLAYRPEVVQTTTVAGNLVYAVAPGPGPGTGSGSDTGFAFQAGNAPGFGGGTGNGQGSGGIRPITVVDLEQYDFTVALGRALGPHYLRGGLHLVSANEAAIDGSYSGFLEWQYTRPRDYFLRLGLATGKRLDSEIQANQFDITAGKELGNPVLSGVWRLQLNYLLGDNDWSGVGSNSTGSIEAAAAWSRGKWRLETSAWAGERMYALLKRGYYLVTQQDLLTGGYRLGAGYSLGAGSLQLYYEYIRLEPTAQTESELSTIGIQYQRGIM